MAGVVFVGFNVIFGFVFGALKTYIRCLYMHFLNRKLGFNYNKLLASNILESMRVVNLSKIENDIATFTWINIPIVSQDAKIEMISKFEVVIDLKTKQSISCLTGPCSKIYLEITLVETEDKSGSEFREESLSKVARSKLLLLL